MTIENMTETEIAAKYGEFWQYDGEDTLDAYWFSSDDSTDPDVSATVEKTADGTWKATIINYVTEIGEISTIVETPDAGVEWCESHLPTDEQWQDYETNRFIEDNPELFIGLENDQARYIAQLNPKTNSFLFDYYQMCEISDAMRAHLAPEQIELLTKLDKYGHQPMFNDVQMHSIGCGFQSGLSKAEMEFLTQLDSAGDPVFEDEDMERVEIAFEHGMSIDEAREKFMPGMQAPKPYNLADRAAGAREAADAMAAGNGKQAQQRDAEQR